MQIEVGFGDDIEGELVVLEIPGRPGGPGCELVVPLALDALKIIVAQPLDAPAQLLGLFDRIPGLFKRGFG